MVRTIGEGILDQPYDPEVLPNGNILVASRNSLDRRRPQRVVELDARTGSVVWQFPMLERDNWPTRDANRLPNGNTLIVGSTRIVEVTGVGEIVWQLDHKGPVPQGLERARGAMHEAVANGQQAERKTLSLPCHTK